MDKKIKLSAVFLIIILLISSPLTAYSKKTHTPEGDISYLNILKKIDDTNNSVRSISKEIDDINLLIKENDEAADVCRYNISHYDELSERTREKLNSLIVSIYKNESGHSALNYLFESKSLSDLLNRSYYSKKVMDRMYEMLKTYKDRAQFEREQKEEIERLNSENKERLEELSGKKEELDLVLSSLNEELFLFEKKQGEDLLSFEFNTREEEILNGEPIDYTSLLTGYEIKDWGYDEYGEEGYYYEEPYPYTDEELKLLAGLVEAEAGGSGYAGMVAVGSVVMNHLKDSRYPDTITGVIYKPKHFSPVWSGRLAAILSRGPAELSYKAARDVLLGKRNTDKLCFKSVEYAKEHGITGIQIGDNVFHDEL